MDNFEELAKRIKGKREQSKTAKEIIDESNKIRDEKLKAVYEKYNNKEDKE